VSAKRYFKACNGYVRRYYNWKRIC